MHVVISNEAGASFIPDMNIYYSEKHASRPVDALEPFLPHSVPFDSLILIFERNVYSVQILSMIIQQPEKRKQRWLAEYFIHSVAISCGKSVSRCIRNG